MSFNGKECIWINFNGKKVQVCWTRPTLPRRLQPGHQAVPGQDDDEPIRISGVAPEVLRELEALKIVQNLSERLSPEIAASLREVVARGIAGVQGKLLEYISLSE
jgi:hypothetical protein